MSTQATDGQLSGQGSPEGEGDDGGGRTESSGSSKLEDLEARFDLLNDSLSEIRNAIIANRTTAAPARQEVEELNDDEPLTASKVNKIVERNLSKAVADNTQLSQRQQWDDKAKTEYPLADPKFMREFKKEWNEQVSSGLDPRHPKAIYKVAKDTARLVGVKKDPTGDRETTTQTSEAPSSTSRRVERQQSRSQVSDDDPRVRFYLMKGDKSKSQIEAIKQKLSERDAKRRPAR